MHLCQSTETELLPTCVVVIGLLPLCFIGFVICISIHNSLPSIRSVVRFVSYTILIFLNHRINVQTLVDNNNIIVSTTHRTIMLYRFSDLSWKSRSVYHTMSHYLRFTGNVIYFPKFGWTSDRELALTIRNLSFAYRSIFWIENYIRYKNCQMLTKMFIFHFYRR